VVKSALSVDATVAAAMVAASEVRMETCDGEFVVLSMVGLLRPRVGRVYDVRGTVNQRLLRRVTPIPREARRSLRTERNSRV